MPGPTWGTPCFLTRKGAKLEHGVTGRRNFSQICRGGARNKDERNERNILTLGRKSTFAPRFTGMHNRCSQTMAGRCSITFGTKVNGHLRLDSRFGARQNGRMLQSLLFQFPSTRIHQLRGKNGVSPRATGWAKPCWKFGINTWRGFQLRLMLSF